MSVSINFLVICVLLGVTYSKPGVIRQRECAPEENVCSIDSVTAAITDVNVSTTLANIKSVYTLANVFCDV